MYTLHVLHEPAYHAITALAAGQTAPSKVPASHVAVSINWGAFFFFFFFFFFRGCPSELEPYSLGSVLGPLSLGNSHVLFILCKCLQGSCSARMANDVIWLQHLPSSKRIGISIAGGTPCSSILIDLLPCKAPNVWDCAIDRSE